MGIVGVTIGVIFFIRLLDVASCTADDDAGIDELHDDDDAAEDVDDNDEVVDVDDDAYADELACLLG